MQVAGAFVCLLTESVVTLHYEVMTKRSFDSTIGVVFLTVLAMGGLRIWSKRRIVEGQTNGVLGETAKATNVLLG